MKKIHSLFLGTGVLLTGALAAVSCSQTQKSEIDIVFESLEKGFNENMKMREEAGENEWVLQSGKKMWQEIVRMKNEYPSLTKAEQDTILKYFKSEDQAVKSENERFRKDMERERMS
ncbi:hypothetical protein [Mycoplasma sp. Ms02]|uniref:hypothetical protein n=1 Tax=Mycoplasma sp. Ms02 TaxID=353851 RepID=UPI001C8AC513|nr:hypothetical protein [Mycoplasma sp. Ms02]QZE12195.1 hypothetical protein K4L35_02525 [Mycoplasma sp. Ms02]